MRTTHFRLTALAAALAAVAACDSHTSLSPFGTGTTGGTSGGATGEDKLPPIVTIDTPATNTLVNVGDSVLVAVHLKDAGGLKSLEIKGFSLRGNPDLGNAVVVERYLPIGVPAGGSGSGNGASTAGAFRAGLRDTVIRRYLHPKAPVDTVQDSVIVYAIGTDVGGNIDTARTRLNLVAGPKVTTVSPASGDSVRPGTALRITVRATHSDDIGRLGIRVTGEASWPSPLDVTVDTVFRSSTHDATFSASVVIPANAPGRGKVTITPFAFDVNQVPGSASALQVFVQAGPAPLPRVTQIVPSRAELTDTIVINAGGGDGIRAIGFEAKDGATVVKRDSVAFAAPYQSPVRVSVRMNLPVSAQGKSISITSFAVDAAGRYGYSVPATANLPQGDAARAQADTTFIVFGRTFALPRAGLAGDITVDAARGNVFVSNTTFNRLEVWNATNGFDATGVAVGSMPWGMTISATDSSTLLVANSGGTNISRVNIASSTVSGIREDLSRRILTRNTYIYTVTETRDEKTGKIRMSLEGPISYSDRPQYIAQAASGRIYYSTRPTASAPEGTIRWLDPSQPVPDPQHIADYGTPATGGGGTSATYVLFNVDAASVIAAPANSPTWDKLVLADHEKGQPTPSDLTATDSTVEGAVAKLALKNSDVYYRTNIDIKSLGLRDTTFVASSGDNTWIAFGEGGTGAAPSRVMLANDPPGPMPTYFSPGVAVSDIIENASEPVFGIALDKSGQMLAVHGKESYFSAIQQPFHLRLQGKYDSFDQGAGIAFHPDANGVSTSADSRLAFVASANGTIEIMDAAYYINRGKLNIKGKLYGPLRVSRRFPSDPPNVILKLFGLSTDGLVVIDLTAADIKAGP